jgi:hypothetical protein
LPTMAARDDANAAGGLVGTDDTVMRLGGVGVYLTNGVFLYRVVRPGEGEPDAIVELEDCYGLDVVRVPVTQLSARRLRVVTPSQVST